MPFLSSCDHLGPAGEALNKNPRLKKKDILYSSRDVMGEPWLISKNSFHRQLVYDLRSDVSFCGQGLVSTLVAPKAPRPPHVYPQYLHSSTKPTQDQMEKNAPKFSTFPCSRSLELIPIPHTWQRKNKQAGTEGTFHTLSPTFMLLLSKQKLWQDPDWLA